MLQTELTAFEPISGGGNSRLWRVEGVCGRRWAVKQYFGTDGRLENEWRALTFLGEADIRRVPKPVARCMEANLAVYDFIEGRAGMRSNDLDALAGFSAELKELRKLPRASLMPPAKDAALDPFDLIRQIEARLKQLSAVKNQELAAFLETSLKPALNTIMRRWAGNETLSKVLPEPMRILSPSDFGFHNVIVALGGELHFVDFEYFGWDDPAKLIVDTALHPHPAMSFDPETRRRWIDKMLALYDDDLDLPARIQRLWPVLCLKWCCIALNDFLAVDASRRAFAGRTPSPERLREQLELASAFLADKNPPLLEKN